MPDKKNTPVIDNKIIKQLQGINVGNTTKGIGGGKSQWGNK
jgi:hypothetical protein